MQVSHSCPARRQQVRPPQADAEPAALAAARDAFLNHVAAADFSCVGAKSALNRERLRFGAYGELGDEANARLLCDDLHRFLDEFVDAGVEPVSFVAIFAPAVLSELDFEQALWRQLGQLHRIDRISHRWDPRVSQDVGADDFSFSVGGRGMFIVGMHPGASRLARRTPQPTLVFNLHEQFEALRASGKYESMQRAVRKRELALQGSINPVLARFGEASEAIQYSGRAVAPDWRCPFSAGSRHE